MLVYLVVLFTIFFCIWLGSKYPGQKTNRVCAVFCCFLMVLVAGFRYRVGTDSLLYQDLYGFYPTIGQLTHQKIFSSRWSPLFVVWFSFWRTLSSSFVLYQFVYAIILTHAVYLTLRQNTRLVLFGLALYFVYAFPYFTFDICREGLAMSVFLYAFYFLRKEKIFLYYLIVVPAYFIHPGAFCVWFVPLLFRLKLTKKKSMIVFVSFLIGSIVAFKLTVFVLSVLPMTKISWIALRYLGRYSSMGGVSLPQIAFSCIAFYLAVYKNIGKARNRQEQLCFNIAFISVLIMSMTKSIPFIFRLNTYFILFFFIAVCAYAERNVVMTKNYLLKFIVIILVCCSPVIMNYVKNPTTRNAYFPYVSVFNPYVVVDREWHSRWEFLSYDESL